MTLSSTMEADKLLQRRTARVLWRQGALSLLQEHGSSRRLKGNVSGTGRQRSAVSGVFVVPWAALVVGVVVVVVESGVPLMGSIFRKVSVRRNGTKSKSETSSCLGGQSTRIIYGYKDIQTENLPLFTVFSSQLISVPSFCYSHCVCACACVCVCVCVCV